MPASNISGFSRSCNASKLLYTNIKYGMVMRSKKINFLPTSLQLPTSEMFAITSPAFSTKSTQSKTDEHSDDLTITFPEPFSAYVHLPFCKKKCRYCDFPVIAVGMRPEADKIQDNMTSYIDSICREISITKRLNHSGPLKTVFFGGGTPALTSPTLLEKVLSALNRNFGIASDAEISMETDPGCFNASKLRSYRDLGVSRVSVGVQSFNDELLTLCGRAHDVSDVYRAIEAVYSADIPSWSLDLMSGLPGLTEDIWQDSLMKAVDAAPHHLSVYDLQIEEHTPFANQYHPGVHPLPSEEVATSMYCTASTTLRNAGYEHYEISNYSRPGHRCAHNSAYWNGSPYYAFGMGAASYLMGRRFTRPRRIGGYLKWLQDFEESVAAGQGLPQVPALAEVPAETIEDRLTDTIMLRLRLADGLDLVKLAEEYSDGDNVVDVIVDSLKIHQEMGRVMFITESNKGRNRKNMIKSVKLTDPEGFVVSNDVISDVFVALDAAKSA